MPEQLKTVMNTIKPTRGTDGPRRILLVVLILLECVFLLAAFSNQRERTSTGRKWFDWRQTPSPQTEAAWNIEKQKLHQEDTVTEAAIWLLIIATAAGIVRVAKRQNTHV